jgi:putative MFS transporter
MSQETCVPPAKIPLSRYQKQLFVFLSVATFFEGYDFFALTQILPNLRADMDLSKSDAGHLVTIINIGTILAYLLIRKADRWGRRSVLSLTIAGYTAFTFLTGFASNVYLFAACQLCARTFLIAEWATSMVYAAEEFPAARRGMVIGIISAFASLGAIICAGVVPLLLDTAYGWRSVYFIGIVPLVLLAFARRNLRESRRFAEHVRASENRSLFHIWTTPYRARLTYLSLIWGITYICNNTAVFFWKDFALSERGLTDAQVGQSITLAALVSAPLIFYAGALCDRMGRKWAATVIFTSSAIGVFGTYTLHGQWWLTLPLIFAIAGVSAVLPVLNAFTTELFPTELRGDAFAWANNLLGRIGYVVAPSILGTIAQDIGWGPTISATAFLPIVALGLILTLLPETNARELEETSAI